MPKETASPLIRAVEALNEVFVQMVWIVMKAMPIFVFALMAGQIVNAAGSDPEMFGSCSNTCCNTASWS